MGNYQKARMKRTSMQGIKIKSAAKNKSKKILRINKKNFQDEELPH